MQRRTVVTGFGAMALTAPAALRAVAPAAKRKAPENFLWGTAISAHQSEGNNVNSDMWLNEHVPGTLFKEPSGDACDSWERYGEDIAIAASLGLNCHRFGIEWARIEPEPGQFSLAALDHYKRMLETCHAKGLAPMVTFMHFSTPRWFAARGGFEVPDAPDLFARFADPAARHFGPLMFAATTFNELNAPRLIPLLAGPIYDKLKPLVARMLAASASACGSDRFSSWVFADPDRIEEPTRAAHAKAYAAIKAAVGSCQVGISLSMQDPQPVPGGEAKAHELSRVLYDAWLDQSVPADFIGVQAYTRMLIGADGVLPTAAEARKTDSGYEYYPPALGNTVRYAARVSGRPVIVTESGIATHDDQERVAFMDATLAELRRCLSDGVDLRGYLHWSLLDNFEWTKGYEHKFGLVAVDRKTFKRVPKPSAYHLGRIARANLV